LENITDLVSPQRRLETLVAPEQPTVAPSTHKKTLDRPKLERSTSFDSATPPTPTARYLSGEKISLFPNEGEEIQISKDTKLTGNVLVIKRPKKGKFI
jgi:hypothetical protein